MINEESGWFKRGSLLKGKRISSLNTAFVVWPPFIKKKLYISSIRNDCFEGLVSSS